MSSRGLFITGTGTEVGKTYVAALIARQLVGQGRRVGVYKPAASGCRLVENQLVSDDAAALWEAAGRPGRLEDVCPQWFAAPVAPHLAARAEGREIDRQLLRTGLEKWAGYDVVLVEGAGGLMSPLSDEDYNADLVHEFGLPLLIVADNRLGVIHDTLQTLVTATSYRGGLPVAGVVLNTARPREDDLSVTSNYAELFRRCEAFGASLLAEVRHGGKLDCSPAKLDELMKTA